MWTFSSKWVLFSWQASQYSMNILTLSNSMGMWYYWDNKLYNLSLLKWPALASDNLLTLTPVWALEISFSWHSKESTTSTFLSTIKTYMYAVVQISINNLSDTILTHLNFKFQRSNSQWFGTVSQDKFLFPNTVQLINCYYYDKFSIP